MFKIDAEKYRSVAFNDRPDKDQIKYIILHYTEVDFESSIEILTKTLSSHFLLADDKNTCSTPIYQLVDEEKRAWHAGVSAWGKDNNLNDNSIGIEIVNIVTRKENFCEFSDFSNQQIEALKFLLTYLMDKWSIEKKNVIGHSDIAPLRKLDPGPKMPWKELAAENLALWYDHELRDEYINSFSQKSMPKKNILAQRFRDFGYVFDDNMDDKEWQKLISIFQMRFRPDNYDGVMDIETAAIIFSLT